MSDRERDAPGTQDFEELGDDVIIAQETAAHAPKPRAQVSTDQPTVVISDAPLPPPRISTVPPLRRPERTEKTVVIRDRKSLDRLRRQASRHPRSGRGRRLRILSLVVGAVLASLAAGTLLAALTNPTTSKEPPVPSAPSTAEPAELVAPAKDEVPEVVDLEDLPVVKQKKSKQEE